METTNVCRGCLSKDINLQNMFELNLQEVFSSFAGIQVYRCEGLSELLCVQCREKIAAFKEFRDKCRHSDDVLRKQMYSTVIQDGKNSILDTISSSNDQVKTILDSDKLIFLITPKDLNRDTDSNLCCPYKCNNIFTKKNHLLAHLTKNHGIRKDFAIETQYYCMYNNCKYNLNSKNKFFPVRKQLKIHIKNIHEVERVTCDLCQMTFTKKSAFERHKQVCEMKFICASCGIEYKTHERLMVHLMRRHPDLHKEYKKQRREKKLKNKLLKAEDIEVDTKRTFATQTQIVNDISLNSCNHTSFSTSNETQTVFEDLLHCEDDFETVSLSDIKTRPAKKSNQTQTNNSNNIESDLSFKETQTCLCYTDSPKSLSSHFNFPKYLFDNVNSSPNNLTSTETQTADLCSRDVLLSFHSAETQTGDDYDMDDIKLNI